MLLCLIHRLKNTARFSNSTRHFYDWKTRSDTIYAPATTLQQGKGSPLGIIRLSGIRSGNVVEKITKLGLTRASTYQSDKEIFKSKVEPRKAKLTKLFDPNDGELIDIGLVLWFPQPNSYTGEDVAEFHVHGSQAVMNKLLAILGKFDGLRPAEPGEFTFRAHDNGKMSLLQVESLSELIASKTDHQRRLSLKGLTGSTRRKYDSWIETLVGILAHLEASIDFGEDELIGEEQVVDECVRKLQKLSNEMNRFILIGTECRDFVQTGARVAILGRPNAGKSTIMNLLCRREKSIVSNLSGTTRDIVEHSFELGGHTITLSDTAGLRDPSSLVSLKRRKQEEEKEKNTVTSISQISSNYTPIEQHDSIEREGVRRALEAARDAHMILYLYDGSQLSDTNAIIEELAQVLGNLANERGNNIRSLHLVINKIDLDAKLLQDVTHGGGCDVVDNAWKSLEKTMLSRLSPICVALDHVGITLISCKTQTNLDVLIGKLSSSLDELLQSNLRKGQFKNISESTIEEQNHVVELEYLNERHLSLLSSVLRHLSKASSMDIGTIDEMAQHVRESVDYLSRIVGSVSNEQVLARIFKDFCIGK